ncbi:MAG: LEA type 2 family protein [Rhodanobacteraceae bacterium]
MIARPSRIFPRTLLVATLAVLIPILAGCTGAGTKLQAPTASIQQLTVNSDGTWAAVVRFQNYSYDTGMHVHSMAADFSLNGKAAGHIAISPALDIPAMDADVATATFTPDSAGVAALAAAGRNALQYELEGTLSVSKGDKDRAQPFKLDNKGYISPVPGVSNIWR